MVYACSPSNKSSSAFVLEEFWGVGGFIFVLFVKFLKFIYLIFDCTEFSISSCRKQKLFSSCGA